MSKRHKNDETVNGGVAPPAEHPDGEPVQNGERAKRTRRGNVRWQLIGVLPDGKTRIIGEDRTKGRLRSRHQILAPMLDDVYDSVHCQRVAVLTLGELYAAADRREKQPA